jgi:gas vesicle protein
MTWAAAIAAITSIVAAVLAYLSAQRAAREARSVTTLNHKIAAIDKEAEQMRDDYRDLMKALGDRRIAKDSGSIMAAGEVLRSHSRASEPLSEAIQRLANHLAGSPMELYDDVVSIRTGYRESMADIEPSRLDLLSESGRSGG